MRLANFITYALSILGKHFTGLCCVLMAYPDYSITYVTISNWPNDLRSWCSKINASRFVIKSRWVTVIALPSNQSSDEFKAPFLEFCIHNKFSVWLLLPTVRCGAVCVWCSLGVRVWACAAHCWACLTFIKVFGGNCFGWRKYTHQTLRSIDFDLTESRKKREANQHQIMKWNLSRTYIVNYSTKERRTCGIACQKCRASERERLNRVNEVFWHNWQMNLSGMTHQLTATTAWGSWQKFNWPFFFTSTSTLLHIT